MSAAEGAQVSAAAPTHAAAALQGPTWRTWREQGLVRRAEGAAASAAARAVAAGCQLCGLAYGGLAAPGASACHAARGGAMQQTCRAAPPRPLP